MRIVTIHQPEHLSYLGLFHKISMCDTLVLLDNVQFEKNYFQNRNRINTNDGEKYITVPVTNTKGPISEVKIVDNYFNVQCKKNTKTIEAAYGKCPYWKKYGEDFLNTYQFSMCKYLANYNRTLLNWVLGVLGIDVKIYLASELAAEGHKTDLLVDICRRVGADKYIAGKSGRDYLELEKFDIPVEFQEFAHPIYTQYGKTEFTPYMSVIDAIFNVGPEIMNIINAVNHGKRK